MINAVELARQVARALHDELVREGRDPWEPYALATAAAQRHGYSVEETGASAASLNGSRATLVPADELILHEDQGSPFDKAFLVGHEVGHLVLGDVVPNDGPCEFDASRSSEAVPVGIDRVVDYSNRQRREIQMDLFARELILPRARAYTLHVEQGLGAEAIAQRLGAPYEVVAQQLFDALLLPTIPNIEPATSFAPTLNDSQRDAARHFGTPFLLEAGPGTGKTQTLTARVEQLLAQHVDPKRILVLTFSNKAAGEMVERIARKHPDAAASMWMGTFHAFGLETVRIYHEELGLAENPRLLDRVEAAELLEQQFPRLGLRHYRNLYDPTQIILDMLGAISRAKDEVADPARYATCAQAMLNAARGDPERVEAAEKADEVARVYAAYEQLKLGARAIDFGDLVMLPFKLLENRSDIRALVQARYDHVLVDEFQDVNRASVLLLEALTGGGAELWAVGDAKQSIYRFRGASSYNVSRFGNEDFPGGQRGRLECNYRSVEEVVRAFTQFAERMEVTSGEVGLEAERGRSGDKPQLQLVEKAAVQSGAIADAVEQLRADGIPWRDQAVLCTGNDRLSQTARELERMGIPVLFLGSLFERPEIKDLLSLLSLLVDPQGMGLVRTATMAGFEASMDDVASALEDLRNNAAAEAVSVDLHDLTARDVPGFAQLATAIQGFDETAKPWRLLAHVLLDRTRMAAGIAESCSVAERAQGIAIWQFMNFVAVQPAGQGLPIRRLLDRIRRLVRLSEDRDLRQMPAAAQRLDAVRLMTVHGAKGLEFRAVHLPGMNQGTLPRPAQTPSCPPPDGLIEGAPEDGLAAFKQGHAQEQECLFYVAMSRARDRLFLYAPQFKENGHRRPLSPYVDRLGTTIDQLNIVPTHVLPPAPDSLPIQLDVDGPLRFAPSQIALFESCPRRFFYTHVLRVGGRRVTTAFMRMHEAVTGLVKRVVDGTAPSDEAGLRDAVVQACRDTGIEDGPQFDDYVSLATGLVQYFRDSRDGMEAVEPMDIRMSVDSHEIYFRPDDVLVDEDGVTHLRRVRTGHTRSSDTKDAGASALKLAAADHFADVVVELIHLSDGTVTALPPSKGDGGKAKLGGLFATIATGSFEADPSPRTCPSCPAFFICGPVPQGALRKKF